MKKLVPILLNVCLLLFLFVSFPNGQTCRRDTYWAQPEKVMDAVGVKEGMVIGEAGAGKGYLTFYLAKRVGPNGIRGSESTISQLLSGKSRILFFRNMNSI